MGFGCGAGPSSGKMFPPFTACVHFLTPGTARVSNHVPTTRRYKLECAVYFVFTCLVFRVVYFPDGLKAHNWAPPVLLVWAFLSFRDQTFMLACRSEVYVSMFAAWAMSSSHEGALAAMQGVQLGVWFWAGVAKHGVWWAYVLPVMTSCNPLLSLMPLGLGTWLKKQMYADYPNDLAPSRLCRNVSKIGAFIEILFPVILAVVGFASCDFEKC